MDHDLSFSGEVDPNGSPSYNPPTPSEPPILSDDEQSSIQEGPMQVDVAEQNVVHEVLFECEFDTQITSEFFSFNEVVSFFMIIFCYIWICDIYVF